MRFKVFISSVQREFAAERQMLAEYVRKDALLGKFFDVFLFEEEPACDVEARDLYLPEVEKSDIYLGILGAQFGNADADGVSPTEREYDLATVRGKERLVFVKKCERDPREERFVQKVQSDVVRKSFETAQRLATPQYKPDSALFHTIIWRNTAKSAVDEARPTSPTGGVENAAVSAVAQANGPVAHQVAYQVAHQVACQNIPRNTAGRIFLLLKDGPLGRADIAKTLGVTRMARSLKMALDTLQEDGLIEYTVPDNIRSRLQKYRLTEKGRQMLAVASSSIGKR